MLALCVKVTARFLRCYLVWIQMRRTEANANKGGSEARSPVNHGRGGGGILYQMGGGPLRGYLLE